LNQLAPLLWVWGLEAQWRAIGPGGGGAQYRPVLSPHDARLVVVGTDMSAGFVSQDQGRSWRRFHLRARPDTVLFDPVSPDVIYALMPGTLGLYRSPDRGRAWRLIYPLPEAIQRIVYQDDEAEPSLVTRGQWPALSAVALDQARPGVLYAARGPNLEMSPDDGRHWVRLSVLANRPIRGTGRALFVEPHSPVQSRAVWVVEPHTVEFWSENRMRASAPPGVTAIREAAAGFGPGTLYLLTEPAGLWVTRDAGRTWQRLDDGLGALGWRGQVPRQLRGLATAENRPGHVYVSYSGLPSWISWLSGVAGSTDGGRHWQLLWADGRSPAANVRDAWIAPLLGQSWGENPLEMGVHPSKPGIVFTADLGRTMRTLDGGRNWEAAYSRPVPGGGWTTTGLDMTTSYGVHFDPFDARQIFISYTDIGLFRSDDGGASWKPSGQGIPRAWANTAYWTVFDPAVRGRQWVAVSNIHDLPRLKMVRRWKPEEGAWHGGVCASRDGGRLWNVSSQGLPDAPVTHLLLDPRSRPGARTLYAAAFGAGLYKSTDDGQTWTSAGRGIDAGKHPLIWRLIQDRNGVLYAVVARRREALDYGDPDTDGAVYRSTDGATTWRKVRLPAGLNGPTGLVIDPEDPNRLYLSSFGRFQLGAPGSSVQGGVYLSTDGGRAWRPVLTAGQYVYDVTLDPARPQVLYATVFESSLWRSADRGEHWTRVPGFNVKNAHRAIADPHHPGMIFVTTYGSSVWYGPEQGDPASLEDIETPQAGYRCAGLGAPCTKEAWTGSNLPVRRGLQE